MLDKVVLATLGALTLTKEKSKELVEQLVKKGEIAKDEAPEFLRQVVKKGEEVTAEVDRKVGIAVKNFSKNMNFATKAEVEKLKNEIQRLSKKIEKNPKKRVKK